MKPITENNLDAEKALLSCLLHNPAVVIPEGEQKSVAGMLTLPNKLIWQAVNNLHQQKVEIDLTAIAQHLHLAGLMNQVGGMVYLDEIDSYAPSAANWPMYLDAVCQTHARARLWKAFANLADYTGDTTKDITSLMSEAESAMIQVREIITNGRIRTMREMLFEVVAEFQAEMKGVSKGLAFGLEALDNITGGMRPGDMIVIAARPGMGKSALACQVAFDVVEQGGAVLIFSLEMECKQLVRRAFGVLGGVDTRKFGRREATQADFAKCGDVIERLKESQLVIDDTGGITANYIRAKALSLNRKNPLSLVIVDYLQLMSSESKSGENREREVAQISNKMKALAKELGCPVMALCQLNRSADKERPRMSMVRESGAVEQDADVLIAISAAETEENEYGIEKQNRPGDPFEVYVDVLKQRGGPIGECRMIFEPRNTRFVPVPHRSPIEATY